MSNLHDHARRELELLGEDQPTIDWYLRVVDAFRSFGHSGGSASATIPVINQLLQYKHLTPLTNDPNEWVDHSEFMGEPFWQNRRNPAIFSKDGGRTYYDIDDDEGTVHRAEISKNYI